MRTTPRARRSEEGARRVVELQRLDHKEALEHENGVVEDVCAEFVITLRYIRTRQTNELESCGCDQISPQRLDAGFPIPSLGVPTSLFSFASRPPLDERSERDDYG